MIIRALSVFERVIYHSTLIDGANPCRPHLEVEAVLRPGDDDGPLLFPLADYITMAGGRDRVAGCLDRFRSSGRFEDHLGVTHLTFPFWTPVEIIRLGPPPAPRGS